MARMIAFRHSILSHLILVVASATMLRCASDGGNTEGEAAGGDPVQEGQAQEGQAQEGEATNASLNGGADTEAVAQGESMNNAVEGGSTENFGAANPANGGSGGGNPTTDTAMGESLNNVPLENPGATNPAANPALTQTPLNANAPLGGNAPLNQAATVVTETPPSNAAAVDPAVPVETAPQTATAPAATGDASARAVASPFQNPHMNWPGKGKVKYVNRPLTKHSSPNGPVVGEYRQGEHPLIYQNGNWVELHDGSFVKGNGLSEKGVGYDSGKAAWK